MGHYNTIKKYNNTKCINEINNIYKKGKKRKEKDNMGITVEDENKLAYNDWIHGQFPSYTATGGLHPTYEELSGSSLFTINTDEISYKENQLVRQGDFAEKGIGQLTITNLSLTNIGLFGNLYVYFAKKDESFVRVTGTLVPSGNVTPLSGTAIMTDEFVQSIIDEFESSFTVTLSTFGYIYASSASTITSLSPSATITGSNIQSLRGGSNVSLALVESSTGSTGGTGGTGSTGSTGGEEEYGNLTITNIPITLTGSKTVSYLPSGGAELSSFYGPNPFTINNRQIVIPGSDPFIDHLVSDGRLGSIRIHPSRTGSIGGNVEAQALILPSNITSLGNGTNVSIRCS